MDPIEVRRLFLDDHEWERTHSSWKLLKPSRDFNGFSHDDETPEQYWRRINEFCSVPLDVVEQWLYIHFYDRRSTNNYGWLNYEHMVFEKQAWTLDQLMSVNVIKQYRDYVYEVRAKSRNFEKFACVKEDLVHWRVQGTWRVPPIVLDAREIKNIPSYSEITPPFQLVEGHTRFGYLHAFSRFYKETGDFMADKHQVYVMRVSS